GQATQASRAPGHGSMRATGRCGSSGSWPMDHRAAFLSGPLMRQEQADAAADGGFHALAGALVAKEAGRLAHQVVQRETDMLAEEMLRGICDLFRRDIRSLPARLDAVTREAEGTIGSGLKAVWPQEEITTVLHDT